MHALRTISWSLILSLAAGSPTSAQERSTTSQASTRSSTGVLVTRGTGTAAPAREPVRIAAPPRDLTLAEKQSLVAAAGLVAGQLSTISGPWKLTPNDPIIAGRADLSAMHVVNFLADLFPGGVYDVASNGEVQLEFKPPVPGKSYLIDCKVDPVSRYEVTAYPGAAVQIFQNTHHLPVVYTQAGTEWIRIRIERDPPGGWVFYSCEVTMID